MQKMTINASIKRGQKNTLYRCARRKQTWPTETATFFGKTKQPIQIFKNKKNLNFDWSVFKNEKLMASKFWCECRVQRQFSNISLK